MAPKTDQLQIRVTSAQKARLRRLAKAAGVDVSAYVLARALPQAETQLITLLGALRHESDSRPVLAELNDLLHAAPAAASKDAFTLIGGDVARLTPFLQNYVAAMVEQAAMQKRVPPPVWVHEIAPLDTPYFATDLRAVRWHLLRASPVPFKRRNLFVDTSVGGRV
jgi:uncharacterized protein (DUF1778 family)